jgi:hypothetical protein
MPAASKRTTGGDGSSWADGSASGAAGSPAVEARLGRPGSSGELPSGELPGSWD